jgi:serine/threonine protein phosphatase 1
MISWKRPIAGFASQKQPPAIPAGSRIYAVGDIHGRLDLFEALIAAIEQHDAVSPQADSTVILLGDLVDRGPESAGVIARAREWQTQRNLRVITGNHEEMFLLSFTNGEVLYHFLRWGGRETLQSYGIDVGEPGQANLEDVQRLMAERVPAEDLAFIGSFEDYIVIGDYAFVHAGIAPGLPIEKQSLRDLRWIREQFLQYTRPHSHVVVHGHTIYDQPTLLANRIGIDTGAFLSGCLTALVLEGTGRKLIETHVADGAVGVTTREVEV